MRERARASRSRRPAEWTKVALGELGRRNCFHSPVFILISPIVRSPHSGGVGGCGNGVGGVASRKKWNHKSAGPPFGARARARCHWRRLGRPVRARRTRSPPGENNSGRRTGARYRPTPTRGRHGKKPNNGITIGSNLQIYTPPLDSGWPSPARLGPARPDFGAARFQPIPFDSIPFDFIPLGASRADRRL